MIHRLLSFEEFYDWAYSSCRDIHEGVMSAMGDKGMTDFAITIDDQTFRVYKDDHNKYLFNKLEEKILSKRKQNETSARIR